MCVPHCRTSFASRASHRSWCVFTMCLRAKNTARSAEALLRKEKVMVTIRVAAPFHLGRVQNQFVFSFPIPIGGCHARRTHQRTTLLSSAAVSAGRAIHQKPKKSAGRKWFTEKKNSWRNLGAMTCVRVARGAGFKRCCPRAGKYDGSNRDYFFPRVENKPARRRKNGGPEMLLTFAFCSPIVRGGRGNGKRVARRLHCRLGSHESAAAR